jgi:spoIIIJ-associated protein
MREVERSAPSVEEAIEAALEELGVSEQEARVQIVQEPRQGLLGIGAHEAVVRVSVREDVEAGGPLLEEQAEVAAEFLEGLLDRMGISAEVDHQLVDGVMYVDILAGQDDQGMGLLIGRHGQTLDALQDIVPPFSEGPRKGVGSSWTWRTTANGGGPSWRERRAMPPSE